MNKHFKHISSLYRFCCMIMLLATVQQANAQKLEDTLILLDTLIDAPPVVTESDDTTFYFDQITITPKIHMRSVPDSMVDALKNNPDFWYANTVLVPKNQAEVQEKQQDGIAFYRQAWFKTMLWVIIIGSFTAVMIWYLSVSNIRLFRKSSISLSNENSDEEHHDIFSIHYDTEIDKAIQNVNFRLAIRLLYLQTLKLLADKNVIEYKAEKTNSDYLWQLQGTGYYQDFFRLTRDFDYTWYGKFEISETAFQNIHKDFTTFKNRI